MACIKRTGTHQQNYGVSGQLALLADVAGRRNQFVVGAAYDGSNVHFTQSTQFGYLNPDRSVAPVGVLRTVRRTAKTDTDARIDLNGRTNTWSIYATDTMT